MGRLEEIRERLNKATLGPWTVGDGSEDAFWEGKNCVVHKKDRVIVSRPLYGRPARFDRQTCADIRLIAHAPDDIKYLLEQITAMQEENERLKAERNKNEISNFEAGERLGAEIVQLTIENATLTKALEMACNVLSLEVLKGTTIGLQYERENDELKANSLIQEHIIANGHDSIRDEQIIRLTMENAALKSERDELKKALTLICKTAGSFRNCILIGKDNKPHDCNCGCGACLYQYFTNQAREEMNLPN